MIFRLSLILAGSFVRLETLFSPIKLWNTICRSSFSLRMCHIYTLRSSHNTPIYMYIDKYMYMSFATACQTGFMCAKIRSSLFFFVSPPFLCLFCLAALFVCNITHAISAMQFRIRHPFLLALFDLYTLAYESLQHNLYLCLFIRLRARRFTSTFPHCASHITSYCLVRQVYVHSPGSSSTKKKQCILQLQRHASISKGDGIFVSVQPFYVSRIRIQQQPPNENVMFE